MRTIKVTGDSKLKVKPTLMKLSIEIKASEKEFDDTVAKSTKDTEIIKQIVEKLDFDRKDLKTSSFNIDAEYKGYYDDNNNYKTIFIGYKYVHHMYIEFPIDNKLFGDLMYALVKSEIQPKIVLGYTILDSEKEKYKNLLIERSVNNARERAEILAKSAEVTLGEIVTIDYSNKKIEFYHETLDYSKQKNMVSEAASYDTYEFDIEADDMLVSDSVNMVWQIK